MVKPHVSISIAGDTKFCEVLPKVSHLPNECYCTYCRNCKRISMLCKHCWNRYTRLCRNIVLNKRELKEMALCGCV